MRELHERRPVRLQLDVVPLRQHGVAQDDVVAFLDAQALHHPPRHEDAALVGAELENAAVRGFVGGVALDLEAEWGIDAAVDEEREGRRRHDDLVAGF